MKKYENYEKGVYTKETFPKYLTLEMHLDVSYEVCCHFHQRGIDCWRNPTDPITARLETDGHIVRRPGKADVVGRYRYLPAYAAGEQLALGDFGLAADESQERADESAAR